MLSRFALSAGALLASLARPALAQVTTKCNPMKSDCPADPALGMDYTFYFNSTPPKEAWETTVGPVKYTPENGAEFTISKQGDSPTIRTTFYVFWGRIELHLKAAKGKGIVSSIMWLSDTLDEVDWEFLGVKNDALSNYFGKGVENFGNGGQHPMTGNIHDDFHNYTCIWTKEKLQWWIDGNNVRTLLPKDANNSQSYPQTPMRLSLGIWAGGDPRLAKGTQDWAGGPTDYAAGPFTMYVKSAQVTDYSSGKEYSFGDKSGSWQGIKIAEGNSTVKEALLREPSKSVSEKFNQLNPTAKTAVYAGGISVGCALIAFGVWYIVRQRRRGAAEAILSAQRAEEERLELQGFHKRGVDPDSFAGSTGTEYSAASFKGGMASGNGDTYDVPATQEKRTAWDPAPMAAGAGAGAAAGMAAYSDSAYGKTQVPPQFHMPSPGLPPSGPLPITPSHASVSQGGYAWIGLPEDQHSPPPMTPSLQAYSDHSFGNQQQPYPSGVNGGVNPAHWNNGGSQGGFR